MKPRSDRLLSLSAAAIRGGLSLLGATWRVRVVAGSDLLDQLVEARQPVLISFWHNQSVFLGWFLHRYLYRRGVPITLFASLSRDGEIVARVGRSWGLEAVRGSASRGGSAALRKLYRKVTRDRSSPILIPDGPRGPIYKCKAGVVVLAQTTGAPIQPFAFAPRRAWRLKSWDRLLVPWPFTRIDVAVGEPLRLQGPAGEGDRDELQRQVEESIDATGRRAAGEGDQGSQR